MSACRSCGDPIGWRVERGRNVPTNADGSDHRDSCPASRSSVPAHLKMPRRHAISASKVKAHKECALRFYKEHVERASPAIETADTEAKDSGKLVHAAIEALAVERGKAGALAAPVVAEDLLGALDLVVARERWSAEALESAREIAVKAAPRIDLAFVAVDEKGPWIERGFELPIGAGVIVGGILDLVEHVGDSLAILRDWKTGTFRDPQPARLPAVGLYAAFARLLWPEREIRVVLDYLDLEESNGDPARDEIAGPELVRAEERAKAHARALVLSMRTQAKNADAWPATVGTACESCAFRSSCPAYKSAVAVDPALEPAVSELPGVVALVGAYDFAGTMARLWEKRREALKPVVTPLVVEQLGATRRGTFGGVSVLVKSRAPYLREAQPAKLVEGATWIETKPARADDGGAPPKAIETTAPDEREAKARALVEAPLELPGLLCAHEKTFATTVGGAQKRECSMCGAVLATEARQEPARGQGAGAAGAVTEAARPASPAAPASGLVDLVRIGEPGSDSCCLCNCDLCSQRLPTGGERVTVRGALDDGRQACLPCWSQLPETKDGSGRRKAPPAAPVDAPLIAAPRGLCFACSQLSLPCAKPAARAPGYADVPGTTSGTYQTCYSCGEILKTGEDKGLCGRCLKRPCAYCGKATPRLTICDDQVERACCDACVTTGAYRKAPEARPLLGGAALAVHGAARDSAKTPPLGTGVALLGDTLARLDAEGVPLAKCRISRGPRCKAPDSAGPGGRCSACSIKHRGRVSPGKSAQEPAPAAGGGAA